MKYSVDIENGIARELLVFNGKEYVRTTKKTVFGSSSDDLEFCEQLENEGLPDGALDEMKYAPTIIEADVPKRRKGTPLEENDNGYNCENWIP